jgi:hypothetical protein
MKSRFFRPEIIHKLSKLTRLKKRFFQILKNAKNTNGAAKESNLHFGPRFTGSRNLDDSYINSANYSSDTYELWKDSILNLINQSQNHVTLKFGDGDYFFLTKQEIGSAKPGKRALSRPYAEIDLEPFRTGLKLADNIACETIPLNLSNLGELTGQKKPDFPAEFLYASVANRWLIKTLDGRLGIVGASQKIDLIEKLLELDVYRDYLGIVADPHLVRIPQKYACDNLDDTRNILQSQIALDSNRTYLMGIGHVKFGLVEILKQYKKSQFLDIGSGIDALAGVVDVRRPYFADWTNFRFSGAHHYSEIDFLQAENFGKFLLIP